MSSVSAGRPNLVETVRSVVKEVQDREVTFLAASISYYTLVSIVPLLLLAFVVAAYVGGDALQQQIQSLASQYLLPAGTDLVQQALGDETGRGSLGALSLLLTVWGALKVFRGLDVAFSRVYGSEAGSIVDQLRDGLVTISAVGAGILGVVVASAVIAFLRLPFLGLVSPVLLVALLCAAFFPLYYIMPDVDLSYREAFPGTLFSAVGWTVLGAGFGLYASYAGGSVAGAFGAVLLLVTWFYLSGILLLTGAVINAVLGGRLIVDPAEPTDRQLQQAGERHDVTTAMSDERDDYGDREPQGAPDISQLQARLEEVRADLDAFESDVTERTVERPELEAELKRYVRRRMRRGHARGWGPYLVLLYGTAMTLGAFYYLDGPYAIVAMIILFLSTLGLYALFLLVGFGLNAVGIPRWAVDVLRERRQ